MKNLITIILYFIPFFSFSQIGINTNFDIKKAAAIDEYRMSVADITARDNITWKYEGLITYVQDIDSLYYYDGAVWHNLNYTNGFTFGTNTWKIGSDGQSNDIIIGTDIFDSIPDPMILIWNHCDSILEVADVRAATNNVPCDRTFTKAHNNLLWAIAKRHRIEHPKDSVIMIMTATGGTQIAQYTPDTQDQWLEFKAAWTSSGIGQLDAFFWHQGEADANYMTVGRDPSFYLTRWYDYLFQLDTLGAISINYTPVVAGYLHSSLENSYNADVFDVIHADDMKNTGVAKQYIADLQVSGVHFTNSAADTMADIYYQIYKSLPHEYPSKQLISIANDTIFLSDGGFVVVPIGTSDDDQELTRSTDTIYLEDGGFVRDWRLIKPSYDAANNRINYEMGGGAPWSLLQLDSINISDFKNDAGYITSGGDFDSTHIYSALVDTAEEIRADMPFAWDLLVDGSPTPITPIGDVYGEHINFLGGSNLTVAFAPGGGVVYSFNNESGFITEETDDQNLEDFTIVNDTLRASIEDGNTKFVPLTKYIDTFIINMHGFQQDFLRNPEANEFNFTSLDSSIIYSYAENYPEIKIQTGVNWQRTIDTIQAYARIYTASQGLRLSGNDIRLGGDLPSSQKISTTNDAILEVGEDSGGGSEPVFKLTQVGGGANMTQTLNGNEAEITSDKNLSLTADTAKVYGEIILDEFPNTRIDAGTPINFLTTTDDGILESHSLEVFISEISLDSVVFESGLTRELDTVRIGGELLENTNIYGGSNFHALSLTNIRHFNITDSQGDAVMTFYDDGNFAGEYPFIQGAGGAELRLGVAPTFNWTAGGTRTDLSTSITMSISNSGVRFYDFPNTRDDTGTPINVLATDVNGNLESHSVAEIIASGGAITGIAAGEGITISNDTIIDIGGTITEGTTTFNFTSPNTQEAWLLTTSASTGPSIKLQNTGAFANEIGIYSAVGNGYLRSDADLRLIGDGDVSLEGDIIDIRAANGSFYYGLANSSPSGGGKMLITDASNNLVWIDSSAIAGGNVFTDEDIWQTLNYDNVPTSDSLIHHDAGVFIGGIESDHVERYKLSVINDDNYYKVGAIETVYTSKISSILDKNLFDAGSTLRQSITNTVDGMEMRNYGADGEGIESQYLNFFRYGKGAENGNITYAEGIGLRLGRQGTGSDTITTSVGIRLYEAGTSTVVDNKYAIQSNSDAYSYYGGNVLINRDGTVSTPDKAGAALHVKDNTNDPVIIEGINEDDIDYVWGDAGDGVLLKTDVADFNHWNRASGVTYLRASSDKVGIGISSPSGKLTIESDGTSSTPFIIENGNNANKLLEVEQGGSANPNLFIYKNDGTKSIQIGSSGNTYFNGSNFGIGTTAPLGKLTISEGTANITLKQSTASSISGLADLTVGENGSLRIGCYNESTNTLNGGALQFFSDDCPIASLKGEMYIDAGSDTGSAIYFRTNAVKRLTMTYGGNIGIGTDTPSSKLQVVGDLEVDDDVILKSPDNSCWAIRVSNAGVISATSITCP